MINIKQSEWINDSNISVHKIKLKLLVENCYIQAADNIKLSDKSQMNWENF